MARRNAPHIVAVTDTVGSPALPGGAAMTVLAPANDLANQLRAQKPDLIVVDWKQREALDELAERPGAPVLIVRDLAHAARDLETLVESYGPARQAPSPPRTLPELHHPASGRLDAGRVAEHFGLSLSDVARLAGRTPQAVHKTPDARSLQPVLAPLLRVALALKALFRSPAKARVWLNTPHPDLDDTPPIQLIREQRVEVVADLLEDALLGHPG